MELIYERLQEKNYSYIKMLYLAMMDITKKWIGKRREWGHTPKFCVKTLHKIWDSLLLGDVPDFV